MLLAALGASLLLVLSFEKALGSRIDEADQLQYTLDTNPFVQNYDWDWYDYDWSLGYKEADRKEDFLLIVPDRKTGSTGKALAF